MYYENEKDPTIIFAELDKGLHSMRIGEQCTAIVRFPRLFDKYPFPLLIKSAFVKLANAFRTGNNFMRMCILQVAKSSCHHLEKIGNVEEIVRCIYGVIHSNDPVARALSLRLLGCFSCIVSEQKNIQQAIITSLDSNNELELLAALDAASAYVAKSQSMSSSICGKLILMTENIALPIHLKLKIVKVFENMDCDLDTALKVRVLFEKMLKEYKDIQFTLTLLHTLTILATRTFVFLPHQMDLLFEYFGANANEELVRRECLQNLIHISRNAPYIWQFKHLQRVCKFIEDENNKELQCQILTILNKLTDATTIHLLLNNNSVNIDENILLLICKNMVFDSDINVSAIAFQTLINLAIYCAQLLKGENVDMFLQEVICITSSVLTTFILEDKEDNTKTFKKCLKSISCLCIKCPSIIDDISDCFLSIMASNISAEKTTLLCECLSSIVDIHGSKVAARSLEILQLLERLLVAGFNTDDLSKEALYCLARLYLQVEFNKENVNFENSSLRTEVNLENVTLRNVVKNLQPWQRFKLARTSMRYSHFQFAKYILENIDIKINIESYEIWFSAMAKYCVGEMHLWKIRRYKIVEHNEKVISPISLLFSSESSFLEASILLKAAVSSTSNFSFQIEYCELRAALCTCFARVLQCCTTFRTNPPPAIATSLAISTNCDTHRCQHIIAQFKAVTDKFSVLEGSYQHFYEKLFDADESTLSHIKMLTDICHLLIYIIKRILRDKDKNFGDINEDISLSLADNDKIIPEVLREWLSTRKKFLATFHALEDLKYATLNSQIIIFMEEMVFDLCSVKTGVPRFFFQRLQSTNIKLAISPSPKTTTDPILVRHEECLALKVEGILNRKNKLKHIQSASFNLTLKPRNTAASDAKHRQGDTNLSNNSTLMNDYFCSDFLLNLEVVDIYDVYIETNIIDGQGVSWRVGQTSHFLVQSFAK